MPAPTHTRITFSGVFGSSTAYEEWAYNVNTGPLTATTAANCVTVAGACRTAWLNKAGTMFTPDVKLTRVRVAVVDATGHVAKDFDGSYKQGDNIAAAAAATAAATGQGYLPTYVALVASLDTSRAGATGKGRFFMPFPRVYGIGSDYRLTTTDAAAIAGNVRTFVNAIATATSAPVVVASSKAGVLSNVTAVRVGVIPDTQRSRRGRLVENYQRILL